MGFNLDLTLHGAFPTLQKLAKFASESGEKRIVYLARSAQLDSINAAMDRPPVHDSDIAKIKQAKVAYVGITAAKKLSERFRDHHKVGHTFLTEHDLAPITEFYVGTIKQRIYGAPPGTRHEVKLTNLEKLLIGWFVPPLNVHGVKTIVNDQGEPERWGRGPDQDITVTIDFASPKGVKIAPPLKCFPQKLVYNAATETMSSI